MKKILYFSLLLITSCTKILPLDIDDNKRKLVINSILSPDTNISVYVSTTTSILDTNTFQINPKIDLYENNIYIATLKYSSNGIYSTNYIPLIYRQYKIIVTEPNFENNTAIDTIPEKILIKDATFFLPSGFDDYGTPFYEATIKFDDIENASNYYEIIIFSGNEENPENYITEFQTTSTTIINEGNQDYLPTSLFFSDILFNGEEFEIKVKFSSGYQMSAPGIYVPDMEYYVMLRSISHSYYLYRKFWNRHSYNQTVADDLLGMLFKGEPIEAYSNIDNGYGIFVGYNQDCKKITFTN